jgi:hypothetical protein
MRNLLLTCSLVAVSCSSPTESRGGGVPSWTPPVVAEVVMQGDGKFGGCAAGDLDGLVGDEIVAVCGDGSVWAARFENGGWQSGVIAKLPGEAIGVATLPGLKQQTGFVTVGKLEGDEDSPGEGVAYLFTRSLEFEGSWLEGWEREVLLKDSALLHAVVADEEAIYLAGYAKGVHRYSPASDGLRHQLIGILPGRAKGMALGFGGLVVACASGELVSLVPEVEAAGQWQTQILWRFSDALARVDADDRHVAVSCNDGGLYCYSKGLRGDILFFQSSDRLRGAVFLEGHKLGITAPWYLATAGYDGRVSVLPRKGAHQAAVHVQADSDRLHHLCSARIARGQDWLTPSLITCGYSGKVLALPFEN